MAFKNMGQVKLSKVKNLNMKKSLFVVLSAVISNAQVEHTYYPSDCKGELRDLGLNPYDYHRKATVVYTHIGSDNVAAWHERHLAKFDTTIFDVLDLDIDDSVHVPHLFLSEEHVL